MQATVYLKPKRDKSLRARHPWLFSGGIARVDGSPALGETVAVLSSKGDFLGYGAWSPESQIRVRMWTHRKETIDKAFFRQRLQAAIQARDALGITKNNTAYRIIAAESDHFPGVVLDRYGDYLVAQFLSTGAEFWKTELVELFAEMLPCKGIYDRSDVEVRKKEGLPLATGVLHGEHPPEKLEIIEAGRKYWVDVINGHKTGFYLDQRDNRSLLKQYCQDKTVLNCFSYTGGFSIAALQGGAKQVINIDASQSALDLSAEAVRLNGLDANKVEHINGDVFQLLRRYRDEGKRFDIIVLDPPKFAENRKQIKKAARGYKDINLLAFKLLKPNGLLFTFSCSGLMEASLFQKIVADAALDANCRDAKIIKKMDQASDHPTALPFPEAYYLKGLLCQI